MARFIEMAKRGSQDTIQKIKESTDIMKINMKIKEEEENQKEIFLSIGHLYYEQAMSGAMKVDESLQDLVLQIGDSDKRIEQYKDEIVQLKNVRFCPACHSEYSADSVFCSRCGMKLQQEEIIVGKQCAKCGIALGDDDVFCYGCGSRVE